MAEIDKKTKDKPYSKSNVRKGKKPVQHYGYKDYGRKMTDPQREAERKRIEQALDATDTSLKTVTKKSLYGESTMAKNIIRLTESGLHRIVKESVNRILREMDNDNYPSHWKKEGERYFDEDGKEYYKDIHGSFEPKIRNYKNDPNSMC